MADTSGVCAIVPRGQKGFRPRVFGMGILIDDHELITCAHVVDAMIGEGWFSQPGEGVVQVCFPYVDGAVCVNGIVDRKRYFPLGQAEEGKLTDIAVVRLNQPAPSSAGRAVLQNHVNDASVKVYGIRWKELDTGGGESHPDGEIVESKVLGSLPGGRVHFEGLRSTGAAVEPGFSGAGVYDPRQGAVVGMVVQASAEVGRNIAQFIDVPYLLKALGRQLRIDTPILKNGHELREEGSAQPLDLPVRKPEDTGMSSASGQRGVAVGRDVKQGVVVTGDYNAVTLRVQGINALPTDYAGRIQDFLFEYLGDANNPVPFGGRHAELRYLDNWLDEPGRSPYLLLAAPAGRGKSALLVRWMQGLLSRPNLVVAFVPVSIRFRTNLAAVVFPAVTARLVALHGELRADANTPVESWRGMMRDYLSRPLPDERKLLLILDGLDEAADWEAEPGMFPANPPAGVRVVVSARLRAGDADAGSWLASLGWDRCGLGQALDLARLTPAGVADVLQQTGCPLDELGRRVDMVAQLHRLSEGDPLLVSLYVDDLRKKGAAAARLTPEALQALPPGLKGYFDRWWDEQRRRWGEERPLREPAVQGLLNLLACALGPLDREDLQELAPSELALTTWSLDEALLSLLRFVIGDGKQQGYVFSHPRLAGYFHERLSARERQATESLFLAWGEQTLAGLNDGRLATAEASPYLVQYYGAHLVRAVQEPEKLLALVSDGWRRGWQAQEGTYAGFLNDVERARRAAQRADEVQIQAGRLAHYIGAEVRCALCRTSVHSLAQNIPPALLTALVVGKILTPLQGLAYARQTSRMTQHVEAIAGLAVHLPEPVKGEALGQALVEIQEFAQREQVEALVRLAPHLPRHLLLKALGIASAITDPWSRAMALAGLARHILDASNGEFWERALNAAKAVEDANSRAEALRSLAPHLPEGLLPQALAIARGFADSWLRSWGLVNLVSPCVSSARN